VQGSRGTVAAANARPVDAKYCVDATFDIGWDTAQLVWLAQTQTLTAGMPDARRRFVALKNQFKQRARQPAGGP